MEEQRVGKMKTAGVTERERESRTATKTFTSRIERFRNRIHAWSVLSTRRRAFPLRIQCLSCKHGEEKERVSQFGITRSEETANICLARNPSNYSASSARERAANFLTFFPLLAPLAFRCPTIYTRWMNACRSLRKVQDQTALFVETKDSNTAAYLMIKKKKKNGRRIFLVFPFGPRLTNSDHQTMERTIDKFSHSIRLVRRKGNGLIYRWGEIVSRYQWREPLW